MKKINIQIQMLDEHVNVQELAELTYELWQITRPEISPSIERICNWIKNLKFDNVPVIIKACKREKLVGWLLLFIHDSKRLEINPWALGGHPHLSPNEPDKLNIAQLLLKECVTYVSSNIQTRMEL